MGASWRYITEEQHKAAVANRPQREPGDEIRDIFEIVRGHVSPVSDGETRGVVVKATKGWFVRLLDEELPGHTYSTSRLKVRMNGEVVELKPGTLVAFLPPNYREIANGA